MLQCTAIKSSTAQNFLQLNPHATQRNSCSLLDSTHIPRCLWPRHSKTLKLSVVTRSIKEFS